MKKILLSIALLLSVYLSAQTVIVEEKYEKKNKPVGFKYLEKSGKFVIMKGKTIPMGVAPFIYNVFSFDTNGKKEAILENEELMNITYSVTESSFKAYDLSKLRFNAKYDYKYFTDNIYVKKIAYSNLKDFGDYHFGTLGWDNRIYYTGGRSVFSTFSNSFNDFYELGLTNQKGKEDINIEKDDIYLETLEIKNNIKNRFKLDKPNLALLRGSSFIEFEKKIDFNCRLNGNDNFDLITKSLSSDSKTTNLYKTTYDFKGKKIAENIFTLTFDNKFFICSDNNGGSIRYDFVGTGNNTIAYAIFDALSLNNFYEDKRNGDIYIYGIFSNSTPYHKHRKAESPSGFYVFKFDKGGKKIWESVNVIDDKKYFERIGENGNLEVSLMEYYEDLLFKISVNDFTEFTHTSIIDKSEGKILKASKIIYNNNTYLGGRSFFINPTYESKDEFKNKSFSPSCFAALSINEKFVEYIKNLPVKGNHKYFETVFSNQGIWLIETDNEEYYKVLLFKK